MRIDRLAGARLDFNPEQGDYLVNMMLAQMIGRLLKAKEMGELREALEAITRDLGFRYFAIGHHVNLSGPPVDALGLSNYPTSWAVRALSERYFVHDPIHRASIHTATGFRWSDAGRLIQLSPRDMHILDAASHHGLTEGFTVPVHVPGEYRGTCSFGGPRLDFVTQAALPIATMIGAYAFEAGRRILRRANPGPGGSVPPLTDRQRDALVLVAKGKADPEIGEVLGIASSTAHEHVENVRRAYGNAQRPFLIARALFDGQISFGEIFRP
ncbi:LuxR family transcriptional regulator [Sphingomonas sp. OTU376]|uniref:LuxR family transcriptional regulator n=1 Tax=Sphingomonas sp. OTU376 TaxID=3043863 RepID=UPI00313E27B8